MAIAAAPLSLAILAAYSHAFEVQCGTEGGDAFGWSIASGLDHDGDGVADIAIGAPCASVGTMLRAGRIRIFSGKDGRSLRSFAGSAAEQHLGAALAWIGDLDGDGKAELVVGSALLSVPKPGGGTILGAGRVDVRSSNSGSVLWSAAGTNQYATFGESVAVIPDVNGDGKQEVAVGARGAQVLGKVRGSAFLLSGATGAQLARTDGVNEGDQWGSLVGHAGDNDGDGTQDWFASTRVAGLPEAPPVDEAGESTTTTTTTTTTTLAPRAGRLTVFSGAPPRDNPLHDYLGATLVDRLGRSAAVAGDWDGDGRDDLWIGSPGAEPLSLEDAGTVTLSSIEDAPFVELFEPTPQRSAAFGTSVVVPGSINGDAMHDVVAGAPLAKIVGKNQAGRVHAFDGADGEWLWTRNGEHPLERFGQTLATGLDYDGDGIKDILVGAPGASPDGKRGAGAVSVLSGASGEELDRFAGRRGRETRIFVSGTDLARQAVVRSFDPYGHRREAQIRPFRGRRAPHLSMAILNEGRRQETQNGAKTLLALGTGRGASAAEVAVYRATRRRHRVSLFPAGPVAYAGGLNIAGGDLTTQTGDELAVVPADANSGAVPVQLFWAEFVLPSGQIDWTELTQRNFSAFVATDKFNTQLINASGGNVAAGNLTTSLGDEIVVAPAAGMPVVRVFGHSTAQPAIKLAEWLAYPPGHSGVSVAVGDLDGERGAEIVTAPSASGQPWIRAWNADGTEWKTSSGAIVSFTIKEYGPQFSGGLTISTADVDLDGQAEIVVVPGAGATPQVLAFETNGTLVQGWTSFRPFGPMNSQSLGLLGMDHFWKR